MEREPVRDSAGKSAKVPLYMKLYFQEAYTEVARIVGYAGFPHDQLEEKLKGLAERFGRKKIQEVCGDLITLHFKGKQKPSGRREDAEVRLKDDVRKLCWQLLGFPPEYKETPVREAAGPDVTETPGPPDVKPPPAKTKPSPKAKKQRQKKSDPKPATVFAPVNARPETPLLQQYRAAKEKHPDMVLLFRIGDFYETFAEDAETVHRTLGLTLTTRDQSIPMAGFPHHQLETYLHKLLHAGLRVAICDQVEDSSARRPVKREVHRVITEEEGDTGGH